jgi:hydroxyethylthiazole kinase-like uncharacterized protein yjeF
MADYAPFGAADAARWIAVPDAESDKYSRGVLGVVTGSDQYPGAAVLGVDAALHTGVGMVRYLGPSRPTELVLQRRPEAVTSPGRVQAWLLGSGTDHAAAGTDVEQDAVVADALAARLPTVLDGGAIGRVESSQGPTILTPHAGELARLLSSSREEVLAHPARAAGAAAERFGCTVLLKGSVTRVTDGTTHLAVTGAPPWLATAGAGDALGGILGALLATHHERLAKDPGALVSLGATAAVLHGLTATSASAGGPFTVLELIAHLPRTITTLLA